MADTPTALDHKNHPSMGGSAAMIAAMDVDPAHEVEFNAWYTHEHLMERVSLPGFYRASRWVRRSASGDVGKYLTVYEAESIDAFRSAEYLSALEHPSDRTRAILLTFRNTRRTVFERVASAGPSLGRELTFAVCEVDSVAHGVRWFQDRIVPGLLQIPTVCGATLLEANSMVTQAKSSTSEGRASRENEFPDLLLVTGTDATAWLGQLGEENVVAGDCPTFEFLVSVESLKA